MNELIQMNKSLNDGKLNIVQEHFNFVCNCFNNFFFHLTLHHFNDNKKVNSIYICKLLFITFSFLFPFYLNVLISY